MLCHMSHWRNKVAILLLEMTFGLDFASDYNALKMKQNETNQYQKVLFFKRQHRLLDGVA